MRFLLNHGCALFTAIAIIGALEQQRMIDLAIASGAFRSPDGVIGAALSMLFEEIEDGIISEARRDEPRFTLDEVEAELRALGKIK